MSQRRSVILGLLMLLPLPPAGAESSADARRHEEAVRQKLQPTEVAILKKEPRLMFDYGLWVNHLFTDFTNDDNNASREDSTDWTDALDTRAWLRAILRPPFGSPGGEHSLYVRLKDKSTWRRPQNENGAYDHDGPHVDYLYASLDLRPAFVQIGRRYYSVGQGIAYSNVNDGAELMLSFPTASLMGFVSRTLPHEDNIDLSIPGGKKSGRTFYALEGKYIGVPNHGLYGYAVFQHDDSQEKPEDQTQDYDYQSQYFGAGSEGKLLANVRYAAELILETGKSLTSVTSQERRVEAWATDLSVTYDAQLPMQPTIYGEYAFGSGDPDRASVTDTLSGNASGADNNFLYFGYLRTGYALSPRLSNLRMLKAGMALKPLDRIRRWNLRELTTTVDVYRYSKDEPEGAIFDAQASEADDDVGTEVDLTLSWPLLSDCTLDIEYGHFIPGAAYPPATSNHTQYFAVSVTTTF